MASPVVSSVVSTSSLKLRASGSFSSLMIFMA
jgi:hypothetical protein